MDERRGGRREHPLRPQSTRRPAEKAFLVGVELATEVNGWRAEDSLAELERLAQTAGLEVVGKTFQRLRRPHPYAFIGRGKVREIAAQREALGYDVVVLDHELTPSQLRNLENELGVRVIDRTNLILDIFALHARTREGRIQVELAQYEYLLPRLRRQWTHLSRQTQGGVGLRGPGETQLELDRRLIKRRIRHLKAQLEEVRTHRDLYRTRRREAGLPVVALVGYTNAGKSSLLNALSGAGVLVEDKLFATLDPTTRRVRLPGGRVVLFTDTVGFIQRLPTQLVAAFRATLEEIREADVLVHVLDITHPSAAEQAQVVQETLRELGVADRPTVVALNKMDLWGDQVNPAELEDLVYELGLPANYVAISALKGWGLDLLLERVERALWSRWVPVEVLIPYERGGLVSLLRERGIFQEERLLEEGVYFKGRIPPNLLGAVEEYRVSFV